MSAWYCKLTGGSVGPVSSTEVAALYAQGKLKRSTEVREADGSHWVSAGTAFPQLFATNGAAGPVDSPATPAPVPVTAAAPGGLAGPLPIVRERATSVPPPRVIASGRTSADEEKRRKRQQILLGTGIGAGTALVILLLLLFLLAWRGGDGQGVAGAGGNGQGHGTGHGSGDGSGSGSGSGAGHGSGTGSGRGGEAGNGGPGGSSSASKGGPNASHDTTSDATSSSATTEATTAETKRDGTATGDGERDDAKKRPTFAIERFAEAPVAQRGGGDASGGGDGGGGFLGGGGGGGGSGGDGSEFFGTKASGSKFVYVIDCSSSMNGGKFDKAKRELVASLDRLKGHQNAYVFFFSSGSFPMFHPHPPESKMLKCTKENRNRMTTWIRAFPVGGGTDPRDALLAALDLEPHAIFFLTDGGFDPSVADEVRDKNKKKTAIHTICFVDAFGEVVMKQIAAENRGDYRFVP